MYLELQHRFLVRTVSARIVCWVYINANVQSSCPKYGIEKSPQYMGQGIEKAICRISLLVLSVVSACGIIPTPNSPTTFQTKWPTPQGKSQENLLVLFSVILSLGPLNTFKSLMIPLREGILMLHVNFKREQRSVPGYISGFIARRQSGGFLAA